MRNTKNLTSILDVLAGGPKTALEIRNTLKDIDKTVVYRTVSRLLGKKKINEVQLKDGSIAYEISDAGHHHHLICNDCGHLECVQLPKKLSDEINRFEAALSTKLEVVDHRVDFFVLCNNCRLKNS